MPIPATWVDQVQVNTTPLPFDVGVSRETQIVQLKNGNLLVSWRSEVNTGAGAAPGSDIIGRLFNPLGDPIGPEFRLNASVGSGDEFGADIAATANGGFVIVYESVLGTQRTLRVDEFDGNGTSLSTTANPVAANDLFSGARSPAFNAQIVSEGGETLLITYEAAYETISGSQFSTTYNVNTNSFGEYIYLPSATTLIDTIQLNNGIFVPLSQAPVSFGQYSSFFYSLDLASAVSGNYLSSYPFVRPISTAFRNYIDPTRQETVAPSIVALSGGGFATAYAAPYYVRSGLSVFVGGYDFTVRTYDNLGQQTGTGDFRTVAPGTTGPESSPLAALGNGDFALIYRDPDGTLHAIDFSSTAQNLGEAVFALRPTLAAIDVIDPVAVGLADGRFAVAWTSVSGSSSNIVLEILDSRTSATQSTSSNPPGQFGTPFDDMISLAPGSTYIAAGPGNDTLTGGGTASRLIGGTGDDVYIIFNAADVVVELAGGGRDTVQTALAHIDIPTNVEDAIYTGSGTVVIGGNVLDNRITGGAAYDVLVGYDGNDTLVGGTGAANELIGGNGDDVYVSNAVGDSIIEYAGGGNDRIETALPIYVLRNQVENLTYTGTDGFLGIGNELNNIIVGGAGRDDLYGRDGNDVITGGAGAANTLLGNLGDDIFIVAAVGDSVVEYASEGTDRVETALGSFLLPVNVENLTYTGGASFIGFGNESANIITGGAGADNLYGNGGNDRLIGGAGAADTLIGGTGDDVYVIGSNAGTSIIELAGEGIDTVETTANTYSISAANVEILRFVGAGDFVGTGSSFDDILYGGSGNDRLYGLGGGDLIFGGAGDDRIYGGTGAPDTLFGGTGDDYYVIDAAGTSVIEGVGEGNDEVRTTTSTYNMTENLETLRYIGDSNFTGAGSNGNDVIYGGGLADNLSGGFGNDVLIGAAGADVLSGGAGADQFRYNGGEIGIDQILDFTPGTDRITLANPSADYAGFNHTTNISVVQGPGITAATSADSTFLYDSASGLLSYDADGSRVGGVIALAYLPPGLTLNASDFLFA
jgi:Ca2+-binding RTX toxin-like protein